MSEENINMLGNIGTYVDDNNVITFQIGSSTSLRDDFGVNNPNRVIFTPAFTKVDDFQVASRGKDNRSCEQIEKDIKNNRLLPRLIDKQIKLLYGKGLMPYTEGIVDGKMQRVWQEIEPRKAWLEAWKENGMEMSYSDFALAVVKRFYYFRDFFVKFRMTQGKVIGRYPIAGMELLENKNCRLGTKKDDVITETVLYKDFRYVLFGDWGKGGANFKVYPLFRSADIDSYRFAAISHHRENAVGEFYGLNEMHEGVKTFLKTSNELPTYIDSFLENSLAAKIHVVIPHAWIEAKRKQITAICNENKRRNKEGLTLLKYNNIDVRTEFRESFVIQFMNEELRRLSGYLSGAKNQGKAFATISFKTGNGNEEERWKIETIDLKYKEYITSLIDYDKRVDEVLLSAVGIDSSISAVSKPGMMSKSGSDAYYNFLIYLLSLVPDDQKCAEPFNIALYHNFPELYKRGIRLGFYREIPSRQEEVSTDDRLNQQQA
jgi:hypothetical protein